MRNRDTKWQFSDFHPSITKPKNYEIFLAFFSRPIIYHKLSFLSLIMLKSDRILESCSFVMMIMSMYPFFILLNINKCLIKTPKIILCFIFFYTYNHENYGIFRISKKKKLGKRNGLLLFNSKPFRFDEKSTQMRKMYRNANFWHYGTIILMDPFCRWLTICTASCLRSRSSSISCIAR